MMSISAQITLARYTLKEGGAGALLRSLGSVLKNWLWGEATVYLYEKPLSVDDEAFFDTPVKNVHLEIVSSVNRYEDMVLKGFRFNFMLPKSWIKAGAVAYCAFVKEELAHVTFVAYDQHGKEAIDSMPFAVDFEKGEVCTGGSRTNWRYLVYQGGGLYLYVYSNLLKDLREKGKTIAKWTIGCQNIASRNALEQLTPEITKKLVARTRFGSTWWKEDKI